MVKGIWLEKRKRLDIFQDVLTLDYNQERLSRYSVEWQPDDHHLARVGSPRLYHHRYQSTQLELWPPGEVEWFLIIREAPRSRRPSSPIAAHARIRMAEAVQKCATALPQESGRLGPYDRFHPSAGARLVSALATFRFDPSAGSDSSQ